MKEPRRGEALVIVTSSLSGAQSQESFSLPVLTPSIRSLGVCVRLERFPELKEGQVDSRLSPACSVSAGDSTQNP